MSLHEPQWVAGGAHQTLEILTALKRIPYRAVPAWLGEFAFWWRRVDFAETPRDIAPVLWAEVRHLATAAPGVRFNTVFFQRYRPGQNVAPHRDPRDNLDCTVIGLYGAFGETYLTVSGRPPRTQKPGDVYRLPCTIDGVQGPRHAVVWPEGATGVEDRYAIILNRIEKGE